MTLQAPFPYFRWQVDRRRRGVAALRRHAEFLRTILWFLRCASLSSARHGWRRGHPP